VAAVAFAAWQAHVSGSYWAATTDGHVVYESRLELARLLLADFALRSRPAWRVSS
jgi:hypothetical protein